MLLSSTFGSSFLRYQISESSFKFFEWMLWSLRAEIYTFLLKASGAIELVKRKICIGAYVCFFVECQAFLWAVLFWVI